MWESYIWGEGWGGGSGEGEGEGAWVDKCMHLPVLYMDLWVRASMDVQCARVYEHMHYMQQRVHVCVCINE